MKYRKAILGGCFFALVLSFGAPEGSAQEPQEPTDTMPKPAARAYPIPIIDAGNQQDENGVQDNGLQADMTPLTGVQNATLGSPIMGHSYWVPGFQYASTIQSNGFNYGNSPAFSAWSAANYLNGDISLFKAWSGSQLAVNYSGGGVISTNSAQGNSYSQQLALAQTFQWNRWLIQILDQFAYLPQSQFGFGGGTNLGIPGVGGSLGPTIPGLGVGSVPNQSIYAAAGPRCSNAGVIQATYVISPRGSITASGSYGILRFVDPGNVDNNSVGGSLGYNYLISREDTLGVVYRFSNYQYPGQPQAFGDNIANVAYGRKITGHLALQLYGGPEFTTYRVPIGTQSSKLGGNASANFTYSLENGSLTAGYLHGLTGGSGMFTGSTMDAVTFGAARKLGRIWSASINFGYAHNKAVTNSTQASLPTYNSWFAGGGVNRSLGKNLNFAVAYTAYINAFNQSGCTGTSASCSTRNTYNSITLNLQWHTRPFVLP